MKKKVHICIDTVGNGWKADVKSIPADKEAFLLELTDGGINPEKVLEALGLVDNAKGVEYFAPSLAGLMVIIAGLDLEDHAAADLLKQFDNLKR